MDTSTNERGKPMNKLQKAAVVAAAALGVGGVAAAWAGPTVAAGWAGPTVPAAWAGPTVAGADFGWETMKATTAQIRADLYWGTLIARNATAMADHDGTNWDN
jgi:hypothetical protein